jgi:hypothetical protein
VVPTAAHGVGGEDHRGGVGHHELLDQDGDAHALRRESLSAAVLDRVRGDEGRPAAAHGIEQRVEAADVEEGLVLASEGRVPSVLVDRGGPDGQLRSDDAALPRQALVREHDLLSQR